MITIGIAGGTGSGKTTLAQGILEHFGDLNIGLISQDSYYLDNSHLALEERIKINFDHPESLDNLMLYNHLKKLQEGAAVHIPEYDFTTHTRKSKTSLFEPKQILIVEGILLFADEDLRSIFDLKLFVDTDSDVRILRRAIRDINERSRTLESVYEQYISTVKIMHETFVEPSKKYADIIVPHGGQNQIALELVISWIKARI